MIEQIFAAKPNSIHDIIPSEFFTRYDSYDYVWSGNCFEWYYAISKVIQPKSFMEIGVRFGFSFLPTDSANGWNETTIYHNAGATCSCGGLFYKSLYMDSLPYSIEVEKFSKEKNCYNYVLEIKETSQKSCLI
jgi:hypothetical protein